jgi:hypothetical protein
MKTTRERTMIAHHYHRVVVEKMKKKKKRSRVVHLRRGWPSFVERMLRLALGLLQLHLRHHLRVVDAEIEVTWASASLRMAWSL